MLRDIDVTMMLCAVMLGFIGCFCGTFLFPQVGLSALTGLVPVMLLKLGGYRFACRVAIHVWALACVLGIMAALIVGLSEEWRHNAALLPLFVFIPICWPSCLNYLKWKPFAPA